jgi:hypothetical protein
VVTRSVQPDRDPARWPATVRKFAPDVQDPDALEWEPCYLPEHFSQARNLAAEHPEVDKLSDLWWQEARENDVLPLLAGMPALFGIVPSLTERPAGRTGVRTCKTSRRARCPGHGATRHRPAPRQRYRSRLRADGTYRPSPYHRVRRDGDRTSAVSERPYTGITCSGRRPVVAVRAGRRSPHRDVRG